MQLNTAQPHISPVLIFLSHNYLEITLALIINLPIFTYYCPPYPRTPR